MARPSLRHSFTMLAPRRSSSSSSSSTLSSLSTTLPARLLPVLHDHLTPQPSYLLSTTLSSFLPSASPLSTPAPILPPTQSTPNTDQGPAYLPEGHHLIYFPPSLSLPSLLPDGTDPAHSPGDPFTRRMWAGGRVTFNLRNRLKLDARRAICVEGIRDVRVKDGTGPGEEKIFVGIERRIMGGIEDEAEALRIGDAGWRDRLWGQRGEKGAEEASVVERRELVFMRETPRKGTGDGKLGEATAEGKPVKAIKAPHPPNLTHTLVPSRFLLFRFSALTFNAHAIHLDAGFCRSIEGHRNLLVHGPLSLVFILSLLRGYLLETKSAAGKASGAEAGWMVRSIEYRNLAPLYAEEEMRLCARGPVRTAEEGNERGEDEAWDVWIEGPQGGMCVRGRAKVGRV